MDRGKMPRSERAKQFAPFDALKGLQDALRLKEYEHERVQKGDIPEEQAQKISNVLSNLTKQTKVRILYFEDGHNKSLEGKIKLEIEKGVVNIENVKVLINNILDLEII